MNSSSLAPPWPESLNPLVFVAASILLTTGINRTRHCISQLLAQRCNVAAGLAISGEHVNDPGVLKRARVEMPGHSGVGRMVLLQSVSILITLVCLILPRMVSYTASSGTPGIVCQEGGDSIVSAMQVEDLVVGKEQQLKVVFGALNKNIMPEDYENGTVVLLSDIRPIRSWWTRTDATHPDITLPCQLILTDCMTTWGNAGGGCTDDDTATSPRLMCYTGDDDSTHTLMKSRNGGYYATTERGNVFIPPKPVVVTGPVPNSSQDFGSNEALVDNTDVLWDDYIYYNRAETVETAHEVVSCMGNCSLNDLFHLCAPNNLFFPKTDLFDLLALKIVESPVMNTSASALGEVTFSLRGWLNSDTIQKRTCGYSMGSLDIVTINRKVIPRRSKMIWLTQTNGYDVTSKIANITATTHYKQLSRYGGNVTDNWIQFNTTYIPRSDNTSTSMLKYVRSVPGYENFGGKCSLRTLYDRTRLYLVATLIGLFLVTTLVLQIITIWMKVPVIMKALLSEIAALLEYPGGCSTPFAVSSGLSTVNGASKSKGFNHYGLSSIKLPPPVPGWIYRKSEVRKNLKRLASTKPLDDSLIQDKAANILVGTIRIRHNEQQCVREVVERWNRHSLKHRAQIIEQTLTNRRSKGAEQRYFRTNIMTMPFGRTLDANSRSKSRATRWTRLRKVRVLRQQLADSHNTSSSLLVPGKLRSYCKTNHSRRHFVQANQFQSHISG